jgi:hypothetical protein
VLEYRTFYGVLQAMARELRRRGVTHVVREASGGYTEPVYYTLMELDFTEVLVVNPAHVKALGGHKTDANDAGQFQADSADSLPIDCQMTSWSHMTGSCKLTAMTS